MNPLRIVLKLCAGALLLGTVGTFAYLQKPVPVIMVEVADAEPQKPAPAISFDEIFESVAHATASMATAAPVAPVQTATIKLNAHSFDESVQQGIRLLSYASTEPLEKKAQVRVPPAKPEIKKPVVVAQVPTQARVKLSSDNWPLMTGPQRLKFVENFVKSKGWDCPSDGMTEQDKIKALSEHDWSTVYNFGFNNCTKPG